jgi:hypothetical protein
MAGPSNWEEELRKLLEGDSPVPPPPPLPPPPVIRREPVPPPVIVVTQRPTPPPLARSVRVPPPLPLPSPVVIVPRSRPEPIAADDHERHEGSGHLATMAESANAYLRGGQIHDRETERMRKVDLAIDSARPSQVVARTKATAEVASVVKLLRQPQTARQVMIASFILSPPKAFES